MVFRWSGTRCGWSDAHRPAIRRGDSSPASGAGRQGSGATIRSQQDRCQSWSRASRRSCGVRPTSLSARSRALRATSRPSRRECDRDIQSARPSADIRGLGRDTRRGVVTKAGRQTSDMPSERLIPTAMSLPTVSKSIPGDTASDTAWLTSLARLAQRMALMSPKPQAVKR